MVAAAALPPEPIVRIVWQDPFPTRDGLLWLGQGGFPVGGTYRIRLKDDLFTLSLLDNDGRKKLPIGVYGEKKLPFDSLEQAKEYAERNARLRAYRAGHLVPPEYEYEFKSKAEYD